MRRLLAFVVAQPLLVLALTALLVGVGVWSALRLPIDAIPDVTNVQVQINTNAPALSPLEVERQITLPDRGGHGGPPGRRGGPLPLEVRPLAGDGRLRGPREHLLRAPARAGAAAGGARADPARPRHAGDGADLDRASARSSSTASRRPEGDLTELRTLQDWVVKPQLRSVPGVAEVNSFGGLEKQYQVLVRPDALVKHNVTLRQVFDALAANNVNKGGGYIVKAAEQYVIRGVGQVQSIGQIQNIVVASPRRRARPGPRPRRGHGGLGHPPGRGDQGRPGRGRDRHRDDAPRRQLADGGRRREGARRRRSRKHAARGRDAQALLRPHRPRRTAPSGPSRPTSSRAPPSSSPCSSCSSATSARPSSWRSPSRSRCCSR